MDIHDDHRPWGSERVFVKNQPVTVKLLFVKAGQRLSLQYHNKRDEFWKIVAGSPIIVIGDEEIKAHEGDEFSVLRGVKHRIAGGETDVTVLEISTGDFDENDIVRLEDDYHRV